MEEDLENASKNMLDEYDLTLQLVDMDETIQVSKGL